MRFSIDVRFKPIESDGMLVCDSRHTAIADVP
jgi:hypothetical protein